MTTARDGRTQSRKVLVVDDDADIRSLLCALFERAGLAVVDSDTGLGGLRRLFDDRPDLAVVDLGLPDIDGIDLISRIRDISDVPILVLTARFHEHEKVECFGAGADDYVTKPFGNAEVLARALAMLRRSRSPDEPSSAIDDGPLHVDLEAHTVTVDGVEIALTPIDWALLVAFVRHRGQILSPVQLLELAWRDPIGVGTERVKFAVLRLRRRLGWEDPETSPIEAVRGFGYRYRGTAALGREDAPA